MCFLILFLDRINEDFITMRESLANEDFLEFLSFSGFEKINFWLKQRLKQKYPARLQTALPIIQVGVGDFYL